MGHNIKHYDYPETVNRKDIEANLAAFVEHECCKEGGHLTRVRWLDKVKPLATYEDACLYIESQDKGWYDCVAVRYRVPGKETAAHKSLIAKRTEAYQKCNELRAKPHLADSTAEFVGCKACGSKLARVPLLVKQNSNFCPVCGADLRPKSALEAIARAEAACEKIEQQIKEEERKMAKKGSVRWLVKIEYHT